MCAYLFIYLIFIYLCIYLLYLFIFNIYCHSLFSPFPCVERWSKVCHRIQWVGGRPFLRPDRAAARRALLRAGWRLSQLRCGTRSDCKSVYLLLQLQEDTGAYFFTVIYWSWQSIQVEASKFFLPAGQAFTRIFPTMVMAVLCTVELVVEKSVMAAEAGHSAVAYYRVDNYGPEATFDFFATDEKKFISHWTPTSWVCHRSSRSCLCRCVLVILMPHIKPISPNMII